MERRDSEGDRGERKASSIGGFAVCCLFVGEGREC